jgi:serine/threonine protein kinase
MTRLNVDRNTSLQELQNFAAQVGDNSKIRGKKNDDGSVITLYASEKKGTGLHNFRKDDRGDKRTAARDAVTMVLDGVARTHGTPVPALDAALVPVRARVGNTGELLGATLKSVATSAGTAQQTPLSLYTRMVAALQSGDAALLQAVGREYGASAATTVTTQARQLNLMQRPSAEVKNEMLQRLYAGLGAPTASLNVPYDLAPPGVKAFADGMYSSFMSHMPDRMVNDTTLHLGGRDFTKGALIGTGGFAKVYAFTANDGSGDQVVVKIPIAKTKATPEELVAARDGVAAELKAHRAALPEGQTHAHMVGLKGAVAGPDGSLALVLESAPRGDGENLAQKVDDLLARNIITKAQADAVRLTLVKDMLSGLQRADARQVIHLDLKPQNFFIDATGRAKLGDFGTAAQGLARLLTKSPVANPLWQSPEIVAGHNASWRIANKLDKDYQRQVAATKKDLAGHIDPNALGAMLGRVTDRHQQSLTAIAFQATGASDVWSMGASVHQIFFGKTPFDQGGQWYEAEDAITAFAQDPNNRVRTPQDAGGPLQPIDHMINAMMHPVPGQRPTATQLLATPFFSQANIGNQATRNLILAITNPNATDGAIQAAAAHV